MMRQALSAVAVVILLGRPWAAGQQVEPGSAVAVFSLGTVAGSPGEVVRVPFSVWSAEEFVGAFFCLRYDHTVLDFVAVDPVFVLPNGEPAYTLGFVREDRCDLGEIGVACDLDKGWLGGGVISSWRSNYTMPAGVETHLADIVFRVRPGAPMAETPLRFEVFRKYGRWLENAICTWDRTIFLGPGEGVGASVLSGGMVRITSWTPLFRRGDANADSTVDLSDSLALLGYLFQGEDGLPCEDAADSNDDGVLEISDAVASLVHLFLGGPELPAPFSECGRDPTVDALSCAAYGACP